jgi:hypothetical protein
MLNEQELQTDIVDHLPDAIRATDEAYDLAREAWGENDSRTTAINAAWAVVETALRLFKKD